MFCYDTARRLGYGVGGSSKSYYTGVTVPDYKNMQVQITVEPGTEAEYTSGVQRYATGSAGLIGGTRVSFQP